MPTTSSILQTSDSTTPKDEQAAIARLEHALIGSMLGTAVGDALGLACEGLSPQRQAKLFPSLEQYGLLWGKGMISDDTEHAVMTAQSLIVSKHDQAYFVKDLAWRLRGWLAAFPPGLGLATGRAILKLWMCIPPSRSGVASAGNGPAMRAAVLGVTLGADTDVLRRFSLLCTRITHTDPRAEEGAFTIAIAAYLSANRVQTITACEFLEIMSELLPPESLTLASIQSVAASLNAQEPVAEFVQRIGSKNGVSGYMLHTLPAVLHVWLRHQASFIAGVKEIIRLGGDSDTTAAILGGIIGARVGRDGIPTTYLKHLCDWPRSPQFIEKVARQLAQSRYSTNPTPAVRSLAIASPIRNLLFLGIVLLHGFRRLLPPY